MGQKEGKHDDSPSINPGSPSNPPVPKASHHLPSLIVILPCIFILPDAPPPMAPEASYAAYPGPEEDGEPKNCRGWEGAEGPAAA